MPKKTPTVKPKAKPAPKEVKVRRQNEEKVARKYVSQADVPRFSLADSLRIPEAICNYYGKSPTKPLRVAQAIGMEPQGGHFRMLTGAAIAYGLTDGGYNAAAISLTQLGRRIVAPTAMGDDQKARREAVLRPKVIHEFLERYNGSRLPPDTIARNVLGEMGVPNDATKRTFDLIVENAQAVGFLRDLKGALYVDIDGVNTGEVSGATEAETDIEESGSSSLVPTSLRSNGKESGNEPQAAVARVTNRVFITHGSNKQIVQQLKELLVFGKFEPVVAAENETVSKPVPDKVMDDMRSCYAGIIHVGAENELLDKEGRVRRVLNQNVLIEIGAAMALYGRKFILLVEQGVTLPSNLQGLYEVRFEGDKLDYEATMKLLKAFNDFRD